MTRRSEDLDTFEEAYEEMVDLLCSTARDGTDSRKERRYRELRHHLRASYLSVASRLRPYLAAGGEAGAPLFETLFSPEDVSEVVNHFGGIEAIMQGRAALEFCRREAGAADLRGA